VVCVVDFVAETDSETLPAAGRPDRQEYGEASFRYLVVLVFPHRLTRPVQPLLQLLQRLFPPVLVPSHQLFFLAQTFLNQAFPSPLCLVVTDLDSANLGSFVLDPDPMNPDFAVLGPAVLDLATGSADFVDLDLDPVADL
tara:strand:- start:5648 stop:6067 length:420 start_codon:yes stop_codon:yes gene_type:complete